MADVPTKENPDILLAWNKTIAGNKHNVRVLCDLAGLTFPTKQLITACIQIESNFQSYYLEDPINEKALWGTPVKHQNMVHGKLSSTDWGIVQINDYWNIGPGKPFGSVQQVLSNNQSCVQFMIQMQKAGQIRLWDSYINLMAGKYLKVAAQYGIVVDIKNISKKNI